MEKENTSKEINNKAESINPSELKGNKYLIYLCNLIDPVNTPLSFGPKLIKFNWIINAQKTGTIIIMSLLMFYYNNYSKGAWLYLSLHGTYGLLWFLKDMVFPDKSFQHKLAILPSLLVALFLLSYWLMGWEVMCGLGDQEPSGKKIFGCFFIFSLGNVLMICTDLQKFITLKYKKGLIDDLFLKNNRENSIEPNPRKLSIFSLDLKKGIPKIKDFKTSKNDLNIALAVIFSGYFISIFSSSTTLHSHFKYFDSEE